MRISEILNKMNILNQCVVRIDNDFEILGLIESTTDKSMCIFLEDEKYIDCIPQNATMVITTVQLADRIKNYGVCIYIDPRILFFSIHNFLQNEDNYARKKYKTIISSNCKISNLCFIPDNNVTIGDNVIIEEFVSIKENTVIGDNSIIRAGVVIGGEGYEFKRNDNNIMSVKHLGGVVIGKNVEIQYNSCIDKAIYPWDDTVVGDYVKIDNLVHIGHAAKVKNCTLIVANSGIGGRTEIGENSWIGFGATVSNGLKVGDAARVSIGSIVTKNVLSNERVTGNFAIVHDKFIEHMKSIR